MRNRDADSQGASEDDNRQQRIVPGVAANVFLHPHPGLGGSGGPGVGTGTADELESPRGGPAGEVLGRELRERVQSEEGGKGADRGEGAGGETTAPGCWSGGPRADGGVGNRGGGGGGRGRGGER